MGQSRFGSKSIRSAPRHGFVLNMTRLVKVTEILELIDEFVKSTAIAALTLVAAGSPEMLYNTTLFLFATFMLFADHVYREDRLDSSDVTCIESIMPDQPTGNHNQFLAAMTVATGSFTFWRRALLNVFLGVYLILAWVFIISRYYSDWPQDGERPDHLGEDIFGERTSDSVRRLMSDANYLMFSNSEELIGSFAMQITAFSVQYFLTALYAVILEYETSGVMPQPPDGSEDWDVTRHGVPWKFLVFGLPSMWFTNKGAQKRLHNWIDALTPERKVHRIFPEEIAFVIMESSQEHREVIAENLKAAAFYDASAQVYDPSKRLDLDLCIFNDDMRTPEGRRGAYIDIALSWEDALQLDSVNE